MKCEDGKCVTSSIASSYMFIYDMLLEREYILFFCENKEPQSGSKELILLLFCGLYSNKLVHDLLA